MTKRAGLDPTTDDLLREQVRSSHFHPNDPPYLKQAWREYIDTARSDREKQDAARIAQGKKPSKKRRYSWESELAMRRYWNAVAAARGEGYETLGKLDTNSKRVSVLPPDDEEDTDDD